MSFNLIDLVKDQFSDSVLEKLGIMLDGSDAQNNLAIISAIPGILSGIIISGDTDEGIESLQKTLSEQDYSLLSNLDNLQNNEKQSSILEKGALALNELFGENNTGNLINAVSDYSGSNTTRTGYLIKFITPIIVSVISRNLQDDNGRINNSNLRNMLNDQKQNVRAAMPFGFSDQLESSNFGTINFVTGDQLELDDIDFEKPEIIDTDYQTDFNVFEKLDPVDFDIHTPDLNDEGEVSIKNNIQNKQKKEKLAGSSFFKILLVIILLGAGFLAYDKFFKGAQLLKLTTSDQFQILDTEHLRIELTSVLANLNKIFSNITNLESAKGAIAKLNSVSDNLANLAEQVNSFPVEKRKPITQIVESNIPLLQNELNKLGSISGADELLNPILKEININLSLFK